MLTSDTYALADVLLYPSYSPIPENFLDPIYAQNASTDITVGNLSAGIGYAFLVSSVIGSTTPCGDAILIGQIRELHICTGKLSGGGGGGG